MQEPKKSILDDLPGYVKEILDNPDNVASANEATGLMPTPPASLAEAESYGDIVEVPLQVSHPEQGARQGDAPGEKASY